MECLNRLYVVGVGETMLRKEVSHLAKAPKVRYSICHTGSGFAILSEWVQLKFQVAERRKSGIMNKQKEDRCEQSVSAGGTSLSMPRMPKRVPVRGL